FSIALKTTKAVPVPTILKRELSNEYAIRYLEHIGATPTMENCRLILENMPLEKCTITTNLRSRGCLTDAVFI
ncbi:unnamed protein product, partial [Choristocarpus tenellus]